MCPRDLVITWVSRTAYTLLRGVEQEGLSLSTVVGGREQASSVSDGWHAIKVLPTPYEECLLSSGLRTLSLLSFVKVRASASLSEWAV